MPSGAAGFTRVARPGDDVSVKQTIVGRLSAVADSVAIVVQGNNLPRCDQMGLGGEGWARVGWVGRRYKGADCTRLA